MTSMGVKTSNDVAQEVSMVSPFYNFDVIKDYIDYIGWLFQ